MSYYPYYYPPPYYFPDPMALAYMWMYQWSYMLYMVYYMEMFRVMVDMWRRLAETTLKGTQAPAP